MPFFFLKKKGFLLSRQLTVVCCQLFHFIFFGVFLLCQRILSSMTLLALQVDRLRSMRSSFCILFRAFDMLASAAVH